MENTYYVDAAIWIDLFEDRKGYNNEPLGEFALIFLSLVKIRNEKVVVTDFLVEELRRGYTLQELEKQGIEILILNDVKVGENEPAETGKTFQENALIKAKYYADRTHLPCLSDDGGLIIPYLNNEPGVKSKRWLGYETTDEKLIRHTLSHLHGITGDNRIAYLEICLCFYVPPDVISTERSEWRNLLTLPFSQLRDFSASLRNDKINNF